MNNDKAFGRLAAALVIIYGIMLAISATFYRIWNGEWEHAAQMIRLFVRMMACGAVAKGLLDSKKWAYWTALIGASVFAVIGVLSFIGALALNLFENNPYPSVDLALIGITTLICVAAAMILLLPAARRELKVAAS